MKKHTLTHSRTRKLYYLPLLLLFTAILGLSCKKSAQPNPCEGVISEGMPTQVALIFQDAQTGENILLSKNIDTAAITITPAPADLQRGMIVDRPGSPLHGALVFLITDTKQGEFKYKVDIANTGSATLSYTNKEEKTNNPCNPSYISVTEPTIEEHPFKVSGTGSRLIFTITL